TYESAKVHAQVKRPSVETVFHALALSYEGINVVAHTHATPVNMLTTSPKWLEHLNGRLFPDEAVVLGRDSVFIPYVDPGVILAKVIRSKIDEYIEQYNENPKVVYMQNHGVIALAGNCTEAKNITAMAVKAARVRLGAIQAGGFQVLEESTIVHLLGRPDEKYRQAALEAN
ncbi:MAG: class II aldolase/adducin family protein, partial [Planctomycetes bacterium]|nr:class II aldolase/adducin family protein [Planctomycetota bacterium]